MWDFLTDHLEGMLGGGIGGARFGFWAGFLLLTAVGLAMAFSGGAAAAGLAGGAGPVINALGMGLAGGAVGALGFSAAGALKGAFFGSGMGEDEPAVTPPPAAPATTAANVEVTPPGTTPGKAPAKDSPAKGG